MFALWADDVHSLGNYGFAWVCSPWVWAAGGSCSRWNRRRPTVRAADVFGFMGHKTGVPFPVMSRISFGVRGAQIPALIRGGVAIVWFGIQTYLASLVLRSC